MSTDSPVVNFYSGRSIFVTGGNGFMGKVLIEKLLYAVPSLGTVYLLLRPKKGLSSEQRLERMRASLVFDRLRRENPAALNKIFLVPGDVLTDGLGISESMLSQLAANVSIVFHCAATLRLEAPLRDNMEMNAVGTLRCLELARKLPKLIAFAHLSTAFCYPDYEVLGEVLHQPLVAPRDVLNLVKWLNDDQLQLLTPSLLGPHPNCYTYSKRMAEWLVGDSYPELPVIILRPSIVIPSLREPMPGWVDSLNGPVGVMMGAGKGVIRTMLGNSSLRCQVVPVDIAINGIIVATFKEATKKERSPSIPVYNINSGDTQPTTWGEILEDAKAIGRKRPLAMPLWYPNGSLTKNKFLHEFRRFFFHLVPAYFIDALLLLFGQKRFMVRIQTRISQGLEVLQYFTMRPWTFECENFLNLDKLLTDKERKMFQIDTAKEDKMAYIMNAVEGGRCYCLKEDPNKVHLNKIHHDVLFVLDLIVKVLFWLFIISIAARWFAPLKEALALGGPIVKHAPFLGKVIFE